MSGGSPAVQQQLRRLAAAALRGSGAWGPLAAAAARPAASCQPPCRASPHWMGQFGASSSGHGASSSSSSGGGGGGGGLLAAARSMATASAPSLLPSSTLPLAVAMPDSSYSEGGSARARWGGAAAAAPPVAAAAPPSAHPPLLPTQQRLSSSSPTAGGGGSTVAYPWPVAYGTDREAVVFGGLGADGASPRGVVRLPGDVFNAPVRLDILFRTVRWLRSVWQQGTHKAKSRGEVRGGGRKPRPQKGTGASRQGSIRSPIWVGGGAAHGPTPRSHAHSLPLAVQLGAYKCALSAKANEGRLVVVEGLRPPPDVAPDGRLRVRTKPTAGALRALLAGVPGRTALLVDCGEDAGDGGGGLRAGARNLPWACILPWQRLTVYHLLKYHALVITQPALAALTARLQAPPATDGAADVRRAAWRAAQEAGYANAVAHLAEGRAALRNAALLAEGGDGGGGGGGAGAGHSQLPGGR